MNQSVIRSKPKLRWSSITPTNQIHEPTGGNKGDRNALKPHEPDSRVLTMHVSLWLLSVLICEMVKGFRVGPSRDVHLPDDNNTVAISLANELFIDLPNRIIIYSHKPIGKVTIDMTSHGLTKWSDEIGLTVFDPPQASKLRGENGYIYNLNYNVPIELRPGTFVGLNITNYYCIDEPCENSEKLAVESVEMSVRMVSRYVFILGETDRARYRPGDIVRFRFIALTTRNILPTSEPLIWPNYQAVGERWVDKKLIKLDPKERGRRTGVPFFDLIELKDPLNNVVQQWREVKKLDALGLSYRLLSDAAEGRWRIVAHVREESKELSFQVRHYILPRFQAHILMQKEIKPSDRSIPISVCAAYTNGQAMPGTFDAQICVCSQTELNRQQEQKKMMPKNECKSCDGVKRRSCMRFNGILDRISCTNITANIVDLIAGKPPGWNERLGIFVEVVEEATGSSIVVSNEAKFKKWPDPKLELKMLSSFRPGFPVLGYVLYRNNLNATRDLELLVREDTDPCGGWMFSGSRSPIRLKRIIPTNNGQEIYKFVLPPFDFYNPASILVRIIENVNKSDGDGSPEVNEYGFGPYWFPRPRPRWDLQTSKRLELWDGKRGLAIQVNVLNKTTVICPGIVQFQVFSNERLPDNTTLMLHFLLRGQLATRALELQSNYTCTAQDNDFGHYECKSDGEINCLEGWTGLNCLTPLCTGECGNGAGGGVCIAPGRCACKPGWKGPSCEICVPRSGCKNGHCEEGGDCVCHAGYSGYFCDRAVVQFESSITTTEYKEPQRKYEEKELAKGKTMAVGNVPRRTVFKHVADLELNSDFGPEFRAVAFVLVDGQMATDYVQIENIQSCSSPALAETSVNKETLKFDKMVVAPGETVNMSLKLTPGMFDDDEDESMANTCLLSTIDVATKNFDTVNNRKIDFEALIDTLKGNRRMEDPSWISNSESAYRAAGIGFAHLTPEQELIKPIIVCPMFRATSSTLDVSLGPEATDGGFAESFLESAKPRLRDFFPEVWLFESVKLENGSLNRSLTVPDSLTSWEANAVCFMSERGLWTPVVKPTLTVQLPFFVEFTPPVKVRRGEVLHLPISIFLQPNATSENRACYEVEVSVASDPRDWRIIGAFAFSACMCSSESGEQTKEIFRFPLRPLRIGQLNLTATAVARRGNVACDDSSFGTAPKELFTVSDAVRRSIRVVSEGIEKRLTVGGTFCSSGASSHFDHELKIGLSDKEVIADSLRSYVAVSGNVIGRALANLDSLIQMPTGCGEQNLVKVAPSVYVLKYLLSRQSAADLRRDALARKAAGYIFRGFENELKYRHPDNGAFSTFGPRFGANGSTWLTAYVFGVFSEADALPLTSIIDQTLNAYSTLGSAFDFLVSQQQANGCFIDTGSIFRPSMRSTQGAEYRLQLTAHVLAALGYAGAPLKEGKASQFDKTVRSAINCINLTAESLPLAEWSTISIAKVLYATKNFHSFTGASLQETMVSELEKRSKVDSTVSGFFKWWSDSESEADGKATSSYHSSVRDLETTAYALLALSPDKISREDQVAIMKWISQQQNENGGFYSTQDTVITLRALMLSASNFPVLTEPAFVKISSKEMSSVALSVEVNPDNQLVSNIFEIGSHNESDFTSLSVSIESAKPFCVSVHFTSIYNLAEPKKAEEIFALYVSVDQSGSNATALCTTAHTTICLRQTRPQGSGMLLVTLQLPTAWTVTMRELDKVPLNGDLQKLEVDPEKQEVSAYFNGFESGSENAERCFTVPLHQRTYVQNLQAGLVTARDYYNPEEKIEEPLHLDSCQSYWEPSMGGPTGDTPEVPVSTTTSAPVNESPKEKPICPTCANVETSVVNEYLNNSLCHHKRHFFVFKAYNTSERISFRGLMYSFNFGNQLASWNTTVDIPEVCECSVISEDTFGVFGTNIHVGDLNVHLGGSELVAFKAVVKAAQEFQKALDMILNDERTDKKYWCYGHKAFFALIKKLAPPTDAPSR